MKFLEAFFEHRQSWNIEISHGDVMKTTSTNHSLREASYKRGDSLVHDACKHNASSLGRPGTWETWRGGGGGHTATIRGKTLILLL